MRERLNEPFVSASNAGWSSDVNAACGYSVSANVRPNSSTSAWSTDCAHMTIEARLYDCMVILSSTDDS